MITYNYDEEVWVLNVSGTNVTGRSRVVPVSFTLGKHNRTIEGDKGCAGGEGYVTVTYLIFVTNPTNMFV